MHIPEKVVLTIISGPFKNHDFDLSHGAISIGREQYNDVIIPDITISRKHATILFQNGAFHIQDNNSANGTKVNNIRIKDQILDLDSKIEIGPCILKLKRTKSAKISHNETDKEEELYEETKREPSDNWLLEDLGISNKDESQKNGKNKDSESLFKRPVVRWILGILALITLFSLIIPKSDKNKERIDKPFVSAPDNDKQQYLTYKHPAPIYLGSPLPDSLSWAEKRFKEAEKNYKDRKLDKKLYYAINQWERGLNTLAKYEKRPPIFHETIPKLEKGKMELHQIYKKNKDLCEIALRQKNLLNAKRYLHNITDKIIPNGKDQRHQWAIQKLDSLSNLR